MNTGYWRFLAAMMLVMAASLGVANAGETADPADESRVIAVVLGEEIREVDLEERADYLQWVVWSKLSAKYVRENKLEATEQEIEEFRSGHRRGIELLRASTSVQLEEMRSELAGDELSERERAEKEELIALLEENEARRDQSSDLSPKAEERRAQRQREVADMMVTKWKVSKSLYEKHGGRVMFQQFGMEPYDAYRQFLREQEKAGSFKILDDKLREEYWAKWTEDPPGPEGFLSEGEKAKEAINKRWWVEGVKEMETKEEDEKP